MTPISEDGATALLAREDQCAQCHHRLGDAAPSRWWCSEDCFFEWQRYRWHEQVSRCCGAA